MASSENLASIDPWAFRPTFNDCWLSELFPRDTETITKALQKSLEPATPFSPDFFRPEPVQTTTSTVSGVSGSDPDTPSSVAAAAVTPKRHRSAIPPKVSKRKSRASKRSQTTFITADPANFRQMVQQVTGVRLGGAMAQFGSAVTAPIVKPEPQRACGGRYLVPGAHCLPTLDTSELLLDHPHNNSNNNNHHHHHQQPPVGFTTAGMASLVDAGDVSAPAMVSPFSEATGGGGGAGLDFDAFPSFPTLESWKVM